MEEVVGRRVSITLNNGSLFDGYVNDLNTNTGKLSLEKVTRIEDGEKKRLPGIQHFFPDDIMETEFRDDVLPVKKEEKQNYLLAPKPNNGDQKPRRDNRGIMKPKFIPPHLDRLKCFDPTSVVLSLKQDDGLTSSGGEAAGSSDSEGEIVYHQDYTVIGNLGPVFYEVIEHIKQFQVVGMALEGVGIGRHGKLCWLQIGLPDHHVFLFDVMKLGAGCFSEGLKSIIENENIQKVLHDSRMVSDMLHHQYKVRLVNVFDTQVANVFVYRVNHHYDWPRYVDGLASCLVQHLDLSNAEVNFSVVRENKRESDEAVWMARPARAHILDAAVKNVKHLLDLRHILMEKMLSEFVAGVDVYLMHVRDASKADSVLYSGKSHLLPIAFQDLHHFMPNPRRVGNDRHNQVKRDTNGFRENCAGIMNPNVYFSKDSLWHAGSNPRTGKGCTADNNNNNSGDNDNGYTEKRPVVYPIERSTAQLELPSWRRKPEQSTGNSEPSLTETEKLETTSGALTRAVDKLKLTDMVNANFVSPTYHQNHSDNPSTHGTNSEATVGMTTEPVDTTTTASLTGSKLLRALIQTQSPDVAIDSDKVNLKPAGQMYEKAERVSRRMNTKSVVEAAAKMPRPQERPFMPCKSLTEQELRFLQNKHYSKSRTNDTSSSPLVGFLEKMGRNDGNIESDSGTCVDVTRSATGQEKSRQHHSPSGTSVARSVTGQEKSRQHHSSCRQQSHLNEDMQTRAPQVSSAYVPGTGRPSPTGVSPIRGMSKLQAALAQLRSQQAAQS